ncbi:hypothetical protein RFI_29497 [Reticulomyxa filosa]|uniref:Kelch motif family protein n=1 Tax=Reticulomyxa filosa TaxID=46433 RepID=X6M2T6_RETFI|nr:hypothetical protein RFI_29497 [Reticulomyxa filosa]|eukprot:ETO07891.1 hypothetical protein RFI_29497 [Reticulomyxa filosa]
MGNQITPSFQKLKSLPASLFHSQCVLHKHEILICGGSCKKACYSYDTIKNKYNLICEYPSDIQLDGHCVVKLVDNKDRNQITLLSFGSDWSSGNKHTLVMKYVSVWSNISNQLNNCNKWVPFTDSHNHPIIIGRDQDNYCGARAVIGGSNNNLLFITYYENNIKMMKTNKQNYQMLLLNEDTILSIEYNEDNNIFQFHQLPVCKDIVLLTECAYICINDIILFFGGFGSKDHKSEILESVHKYSIEKTNG